MKIVRIPSIQDQKSFLKRQSLSTSDEYEIEIPNSWKVFERGYISPSPEEIRTTFKGFSSTQLAKMLGLSDGRVIRRWKSGESEIPYSAWRLFLIITERVVDLNEDRSLFEEKNKE
ncbi:hypothetical protein [Silvanigrella aquatica]|uniref:Uncharacterized protein n=1 Tax=Silvanigrella aquatica TaxID=1915309 RepID=A0A1L4D4W9_9BACT|nr:hypothetical protein [Silvanigrella aquatica]APJ05244.1 hypothetical protein AXG55_14575 [Silvanigrella aquatica]